MRMRSVANSPQTNHERATACAVTIAGSDSCGGAGLQADLKTFTRFGVYGASIVTAVTAQNTAAVRSVQILDAEFVRAQLDAVFADLRVDAVKTGMLANRPIIAAIAQFMTQRPELPLVVDPVMVAASGARLLDEDAIVELKDRLLPAAVIVTPNRPEAAALTGLPENTPARELGQALLESGCRAVLVKDGHGSADTVEDVLVAHDGSRSYLHPRVHGSVHGTGCCLSAAIAAGLALGSTLDDSVERAIAWLQSMIRDARLPLTGKAGLLPIESTEPP